MSGQKNTLATSANVRGRGDQQPEGTAERTGNITAEPRRRTLLVAGRIPPRNPRPSTFTTAAA
jgi:hypothetical protein